MTDVYSCEADAVIALKKIDSMSSQLHDVEASIKSFQSRLPGRPPQKKPSATKTKYKLEWTIVPKEEDVERMKAIAGCFVLVSNVPKDGEGALDSKELLKTYKGQYGVESGFAFFKDPVVVNDTFLKKPSRVDALGMDLVISLMVWRLIERSLRALCGEHEKAITGMEETEDGQADDVHGIGFHVRSGCAQNA